MCFRADARTNWSRIGNQRGSFRRRDAEDNAPSSCCNRNVPKYCLMISGMLMRNAAEKFWIAISICRSGESSSRVSCSARLWIFPD